MFLQLRRECLRICQSLSLIFFEVIAQRFAKRNCLRSDNVNQWSTLNAREKFAIDLLGVLFLAKDQATARATQSFVRRRRHVVSMRHRRRMQSGDDGTSNVCDVSKHARAD